MIVELGRRIPLNEAVQKTEAFSSSVPHGCKDCLHPIEPYLGLFPSEVMKEGYGLLLNIPRINLFGTQTTDEYSESKNRSVQKKLSKCGIECLKKNPPLACALIENDHAVIALIDGHHRVRNLGKTKGKPISSPVLVLTISELSQALIIASPDSKAYFTKEALESSIRADIAATLASFRTMPVYKQPVPIYGIKSTQDLSKRFNLG